jgi:hypothetical protein
MLHLLMTRWFSQSGTDLIIRLPRHPLLGQPSAMAPANVHADAKDRKKQ